MLTIGSIDTYMFSEIEVTCPESGETYVVNVKNPAEEWICPGCGQIHEEHCYTLYYNVETIVSDPISLQMLER